MTELERGEVLCIPKRRRLTHAKLKNPEGQEELHVFYGEKEVVFDEPEFVPFGEKLIEVEKFRAEEALAWSNGAPYDWGEIREMLEALLEQDILKRISDPSAQPAAETFPATLGLAQPGQEPRTFSAHDDRCPVITGEAFGRELDLSNLEVLIPIYRVGHPAMDADGRQVGENNVTPRTLFLDLPTQRRVCNYAGSRYQSDVPMNITALKHMTKRWPELLSLSEQLRVALWSRLSPRNPAALTVGEVHYLCVCTLASVGYVMVRGDDPVPNGQLDGGLAAMFRLIDGVRLVTTDMMRQRAGGHSCEAPLSAQGIADYADRYNVYRGNLGVCAGPPALIDEYLRVLLGEAPAPIQIEPDVATRLGDIGAAIDYGLLGQRLESLVRIFGSSQGLLLDRLRGAFKEQPAGNALKALLDEPIDSERYPLLREDHALVDTFKLELEVNRWLFARGGEGLPKSSEAAVKTIDELMKLDPQAQAAARRKLSEFFAAVPGAGELGESIRGELAAAAADIFALERRCLRAVGSEQRQLNESLRRASGRPLTGADLETYTRPRNGPSLSGVLTEGLRISVHTGAAATVLAHGDRSVTVSD